MVHIVGGGCHVVQARWRVATRSQVVRSIYALRYNLLVASIDCLAA